MEAPRKEIQLPPSADGYYRFGSLPGLIADALHPQEDCPRDHLTKVVIWRAEDGRRVGRYYECLPPAGALLTSFERVDEWTAVPLSPVEVKRTWRRARYNVMRRLPESMRQFWPDGSLVVDVACTSQSDAPAWSWAMEEDSYATQLHQAVQLPSGTPGRLQVVDGNHNEIECRDGSALNDGYVHIAWLNDWGTTQQPATLFVEDVNPTNRDEDHAPEPPRVARTRRDALTSVIERAVKESSDPISPVEVMKVLRKMAGSAERPDPLLGVDDNGDIKWGLINSDDKPKFLNTDALGKRMRRLTDRQAPIDAD
ncbi:MAG: hypothetical protein J0I00_14690 [Burkholderiales bacterium]|nr:hypothetical protein [Burkholderiales bacterium]